MTNPSPEAIQTSLNRLRMLRLELATSAVRPEPGASLVPLLTVSAQCAAIDTACAVLEGALARGLH